MRPRLTLCKVLVRKLHSNAIATEHNHVSIRVATRDDLDLAANEMPDQLCKRFVEAAMSRGDICLAAFHGGQLLSFVWRSFTTAPHCDGVWVRVERPYWYTYKTFTRPDFRGLRLSGLLTATTFVAIADIGAASAS